MTTRVRSVILTFRFYRTFINSVFNETTTTDINNPESQRFNRSDMITKVNYESRRQDDITSTSDYQSELLDRVSQRGSSQRVAPPIPLRNSKVKKYAQEEIPIVNAQRAKDLA